MVTNHTKTLINGSIYMLPTCYQHVTNMLLTMLLIRIGNVFDAKIQPLTFRHFIFFNMISANGFLSTTIIPHNLKFVNAHHLERINSLTAHSTELFQELLKYDCPLRLYDIQITSSSENA